ncbi:MAG: TetR/AcrR family transcriptional regulator [Gammaproteobacteria bacterium]|nr:MAG: TetR/AcrR family transcriptional regulator [Gammaproteobacteria bacterium]
MYAEKTSSATIRRDPAKTRGKLLKRAFTEIHEHGFQAASLDTILKDTGVTKGALYHHFPNKNALGCAVIDEVIQPMVYQEWIAPLVESDEDPITAIKRVIHRAGDAMTLNDLKLGCPLNNLSQEMSPIDEEFRHKLDGIYDQWRKGIAIALRNGMKSGSVRSDIQPDSVATFLVASLEGCIGMAKNAQSLTVLMQCGNEVFSYLDNLRSNTGKKESK